MQAPTPHPASAAAQPYQDSGAAPAPRVPAPAEALSPREHRKALPTSLDCSQYTAEKIAELFQMPDETRWQITTLNFSGNKAFTEAHFDRVARTFDNLQTLYIDGTAVSPNKQTVNLKYNAACNTMIALNLTVNNRFFTGCDPDTLPYFGLQSLDAAELQAFIAALKYPANKEHVAAIEVITFAGNTALTDELFEEIISLLPNVKMIYASYTNITRLPASLKTREYLKEVYCDECPHITDHTRPAGLRPEIQVRMQIMTAPAQQQQRKNVSQGAPLCD